jgi:hypothetical protein
MTLDCGTDALMIGFAAINTSDGPIHLAVDEISCGHNEPREWTIHFSRDIFVTVFRDHGKTENGRLQTSRIMLDFETAGGDW